MADLTTTAADSLKEASDLIADVRAGRGTLGKLVTDDALYRELNSSSSRPETSRAGSTRGVGHSGAC